MLAFAIATLLDCSRESWSHHKADPSPAPYPPSSAERARFWAPLVPTENPVILEAIVVNFTFAPHINHPGCRNPTPSTIREWVVMERHVRLPVPSGIRFGDGEWWW